MLFTYLGNSYIAPFLTNYIKNISIEDVNFEKEIVFLFLLKHNKPSQSLISWITMITSVPLLLLLIILIITTQIVILLVNSMDEWIKKTLSARLKLICFALRDNKIGTSHLLVCL